MWKKEAEESMSEGCVLTKSGLAIVDFEGDPEPRSAGNL